VSKTSRWHLEEEQNLLCDDNRCRAFEQAFNDGYDCQDELYSNYTNNVYKLTGVKIDRTEAVWDCTTFDIHFDLACDPYKHGV
jgi:hypothetical protein